jgi:hypothetical protein
MHEFCLIEEEKEKQGRRRQEGGRFSSISKMHSIPLITTTL